VNVLRRWWAALLRRWRRRLRADVERETGEVASGRELDALATALEVSRLTDEQFVQVLDTVRMLDESGAGVSVSGMSTQSLVDLIARASREQLRALADHAELREFLLSELFDRMAQHLVVDVDQRRRRAVALSDAHRRRFLRDGPGPGAFAGRVDHDDGRRLPANGDIRQLAGAVVAGHRAREGAR